MDHNQTTPPSKLDLKERLQEVQKQIITADAQIQRMTARVATMAATLARSLTRSLAFEP